MTAIAQEDQRQRLRDTEGFVVESPDGDLGRVEEIWVGDSNEPRALAVRTAEGRHGLLMSEEVLAIDRENHWVVVPPDPPLLELGSPRLVGDGGGGGTISASWATTGDVLHASLPPRRPWRLPFGLPHVGVSKSGEPTLWQAVAVLLTSIAFAVALVIALAFLVAHLLTGAAY